jgi:TolB-like protein/Flp pilus assembly protein TadD
MSETPPTTGSGAVFLSYAREDTDAVRRIADALRAFGVEVWFDQSELRGGDAWDTKIKTQIRACALFLPIISQQTQRRMEGYFRREWLLAVERTRDMAQGVAFIVPVVIDETGENAAVPEEFVRYQWTRLPHGVPTPQFVEQVKGLLTSPYHPPLGRRAEPPGPVPGPAARARPTVATRTWMTLAALFVAAAAIVAVWRNSTPAPTEKAANREVTSTTVASDKSIAVLPFANLSADKSDEFLSDGMTDELLSALTRIRGLRVPGRSACFAFKGKTEEGLSRRVGEQLRVKTVLEGSVRRVGDKLRITAQLINVADGFQLWSETFNRDMTDILAVQSEVARQVATALQLQLGVADTQRLQAKPTANPAAYELYLKGRFYLYKHTDQTSKQAIACFHQAIALDPAFARAYAGLASMYSWLSSVYLPPAEAMPQAKRYIVKALELDDSSAEAHHSYATIKWWGDWDFPGAEQEFRRSLELNPNDARVHLDFCDFLRNLGRFDEALQAANRAAQLSPADGARSLAYLHFCLQQHDQAAAFARQWSQSEPDSPWAHFTFALIQLWQGNKDAAIASSSKALELAGTGSRGVFMVFQAAMLARTGRPAEARGHLAEIERLRTQTYLSPVFIAEIHECLGDRESALQWLQTAYAERCDHLLLLNTDPRFATLRTDPRVVDLLKKVGLLK